MGAGLPALTQMVIDMSKWMQANWWIVGIAIFGTVWGTRTFYKTEKDSFLVNLFESIQPLFEEIYLKVCWKFYKLLTESVEFENLVIEKILESGNYKLFAHHFTYHTKTDIKYANTHKHMQKM